MPTLKQRLNLITRRSWNPYDFDYLRNFKKAYSFTKSLGLDCPVLNSDFSLKLSPEDRRQITNEILTEIYINSNLQIEDLALKCFLMSKQLQSYLKSQFNLDSTITSGTVFSNYLKINYESKRSIARRLANSSFQTPIKFHTWITLSNLEVIDICLPPSMWLETFQAGIHSDKKQFEKLAWFIPDTSEKKGLFYKPIFLGYDYFNKITIAPELHHIFK